MLFPKQQLDTQDATVRQLEGTFKLDQGQVDNKGRKVTNPSWNLSQNWNL
jgi:hypothetical protein